MKINCVGVRMSDSLVPFSRRDKEREGELQSAVVVGRDCEGKRSIRVDHEVLDARGRTAGERHLVGLAFDRAWLGVYAGGTEQSGGRFPWIVTATAFFALLWKAYALFRFIWNSNAPMSTRVSTLRLKPAPR